MDYLPQEYEQISKVKALYQEYTEAAKGETPVNPFVARTIVNVFNRLDVETKVKMVQEYAPDYYDICSTKTLEDGQTAGKITDAKQIWLNYVGMTNLSEEFANGGLSIEIDAIAYEKSVKEGSTLAVELDAGINLNEGLTQIVALFEKPKFALQV